MKKIYIIPQAKLAATSFNPLMYTTSIDNGGDGNEDDVDSKRRHLGEDCETGIKSSNGFYAGWE